MKLKFRRSLAIAALVPTTLVLGACDADRSNDSAMNAPADRSATRAPDAAMGTAPNRETARNGAPSGGTAGNDTSMARNEPRAGTANGDTDAGKGGPMTSASLTAAVKAKIMKEPSLSAMRIDVDSSSDGKVTLSGEVDSATARRHAEELARATDGVRDVENKLVVRSA